MISQVNESSLKYPWFLNNSVDERGYGLFLTSNGRYVKQHYTQADEMDAETAERALAILNSRLPKKARMNYYQEGYTSEGMKIHEDLVIVGITDKGRRVFWNNGDKEWFDDPAKGTLHDHEEARRIYLTMDREEHKAQGLKFKRVFIGDYSPNN